MLKTLKERDFLGLFDGLGEECISGRPHGSLGAVLHSTVQTTWMGIHMIMENFIFVLLRWRKHWMADWLT